MIKTPAEIIVICVTIYVTFVCNLLVCSGLRSDVGPDSMRKLIFASCS